MAEENIISIKKCSCGGELKVYDSRVTDNGMVIYRRKRCVVCGKTIGTAEFVSNLQPMELNELDLKKILIRPDREQIYCGTQCEFCTIKMQKSESLMICRHEDIPPAVSSGKDYGVIAIINRGNNAQLTKYTAPGWCPKRKQ